MRMINLSFFGIILFSYSFAFCAKTIPGNAGNSLETFTFPIDTLISTKPGHIFYCAAAHDQSSLGKAKDYSISMVLRKIEKNGDIKSEIIPIAPEKATVNSQENQPNPLYDQGILHLGIIEAQDKLVTGLNHHLCAVTAADPSSLYLYNFINYKKTKQEDGSEGNDVIAQIMNVVNGNRLTQNIPDAQGQVTSGIVGLVGGVIRYVKKDQKVQAINEGAHILLAVKPHEGNFGDPGTGIARVILGVRGDSKNSLAFVVDAATGKLFEQNKAIPLDKTSSQIKIGGDLHAIDESVIMLWHPTVQRFYIGLKTQSGSNSDDGCKAIAIARVQDGDDSDMSINSIVSDSVFRDKKDAIVGSTGAFSCASVHQLAAMHTSTSLPYLIVVGGSGPAQQTKRSVYALPLVSYHEDKNLIGSIANKRAKPEQMYQVVGKTSMFSAHMIKEAATQQEDMTYASDDAARVGGGPISFGDIDHIFVRSDAVYVSVSKSDTNDIGGVFYSRALFDVQGKICSWTNWQRATGLLGNISACLLDTTLGIFTVFQKNKQQETTTLQITEWSKANGESLNSIQEWLQKTFLNLQSIQDFLSSTPGLNGIHLWCIGGKNNIALIQTGKKQQETTISLSASAYEQTREYTEIITDTFPQTGVHCIEVHGGVLSEVGPISASEIGTNGINSWLFVGGARGLAGLAFHKNLGEGFAGIVAGSSFRKIGNYSFIRKLVADKNFLYVLTDKKLDRIDLSEQNFQSVTLAQVGSSSLKVGIFLDVIISGNFALLATNQGLYRVGNNKDISHAAHENDLFWESIYLPEMSVPPYKLFPITQSGRMQDFAINKISNVYVLCSHRSKNQSQVYRLVINPTDKGPITDETIQLFPDLFVKDKLSYFTSYNNYKLHFITDGARYMAASEKNGDELASLSLLPYLPEIQGGLRFMGTRSKAFQCIDLSKLKQISGLFINSVDGSVVLATNDGLRVNQ